MQRRSCHSSPPAPSRRSVPLVIKHPAGTHPEKKQHPEIEHEYALMVVPIGASARSRKPAWVETSMLSSSARASAGSSTGVLPRRHDVAGPEHRAGWVDRHDLVGDQPIEQMTDRGEPLLDTRYRAICTKAERVRSICSSHSESTGSIRKPSSSGSRAQSTSASGITST